MRLSRLTESLRYRIDAFRHPNRILRDSKLSLENLRPFFALPEHVSWKEVCARSAELTAVVAGNGPSLAQTLIHDFPQAEWIVCNMAHRVPGLMAREPAWWVWGDPLSVWPECVKESFRFAAPDTTFVFRAAPNELPEEARNVRQIRIGATRKLLDEFHNPKPPAAMSPIRGTEEFYTYRHSPMLGIQVALWLGYRTIILIGNEHDYTLRQLVGSDFVSHAYEEASSDVERLQQLSFLEFAHEVRLTWGMYAGLKNLARRMGALIVDATPGGSIDVFSRTSID